MIRNKNISTSIACDHEYDFPEIGKKDMYLLHHEAIYTMVKNNTFNGINLPSIYLLKSDQSIELIKEFGYEDFKRRL